MEPMPCLSFKWNGYFVMIGTFHKGMIIWWHQLFMFCRNGLSADTKKISAAQTADDDVLVSREERSFRMWINSLGIATYVNNLFEDVKNG